MGQYKTGTISVNNGETTVTGTGTNWQAANIREGCVIEIAGQEKLIASLTDTTHLELSVPWSGANQADVLYAIQYTSPDFGTNWGVSQQVMDVIDRLSSALGADGADGGLDFTASISTAGGDPGAGKVAGNNAVAASVTELTISNTDANGTPGTDVSAWLDTLAGRSLLMIDKSARSHIALFSVSAVVDSGGFRTLTVSHVAGGMGWADGANLLIQGSGPQGPQGAAGASILTGAGAPSDANGVDGDFYVNSSNADFYQKAGGTWGTPLGNFAGSTGADGASVLSGSGVPGAGLGVDGDSYIDVASGDTYSKAAGVWALTGNIKGPQGDPGTDGLDGADGTDPGILLTWDDGTADANPGAGNVRADNADLSLAGFLYVSKTNRAANDISTWLAGLDHSTNPTKKAELVLTRSGGNAQAKFDLTAVTDATGYVKLAISNHSGATGFVLGNAVSLQAYPVGDKGLDGAGSGDMVAATYDPTGVSGDAFDMANMAEAADAKVMTAAERTKLGYLTATGAIDLDAVNSRVNALDSAVVLKGGWDASAGTFPGGGTAQAGESWQVTTAGTVDGVAFSLNDRVIAIVDNASTTTYASNWLIADYSDTVASVAGKTGAVTLDVADVSNALDATGDTMTGALTIAPASGWSQLALNKPASGQASAFTAKTAGVARWQLVLAGAGAESGSDAGSDFALSAYNDAGTYIGRALAIIRATLAANFGGTLSEMGSRVYSANNLPPASGVTLADSDGIYDATDVETALAEAKRKLAGINTQTGTTYTLALADAGKVVEANNASAVTFTVPPNSSVAFPIGTRIDLTQYGAGQLSVAAGAGVTIRSASSNLKLSSQYSGASLYKRAPDEWMLVGDLTA